MIKYLTGTNCGNSGTDVKLFTVLFVYWENIIYTILNKK